MGTFKYKAFISYSHQDKTWARWLHKRLETYPIPKRLVGTETPKGVVPKRLNPIFRDQEELEAAGSLSDKIEEGLASSENMVILCSPRSAKSHWVNTEIIRFKTLHPKGSIFSVLIDGEPFATDISGREDEECLPPALRYELGADGELTDQLAEPLAADLRANGDGKRLGSLKIVSGMIGVGLDEIIQRDMRRGRRRVMTITALGSAAMLIMASLTTIAISARKEAEAGRNDAEGLIEFMLTDLREKLEPVSRLDVLESVGQEAVKYYDGQDLDKMKDDALGRRARVFNYLGEIDENLGQIDVAIERWKRSYETTKTLLGRKPNDQQRIFDHAQSAFWVGYGHEWGFQQYGKTEEFYSEYKSLSDQLSALNPENLDWQMERAWGYSNLSRIYSLTERNDLALKYAQKAVGIFEKINSKRPNHYASQVALAKDGYAVLGGAQSYSSPIHEYLTTLTKQLKVYESLLKKSPNNVALRELISRNQLSISGQLVFRGDIDAGTKLIAPALNLSRQVLEADSANIEYKRSHFHRSMMAARLYLDLNHVEKALEIVDENEALLERIKSTAENPELLFANYQSGYAYIKSRIYLAQNQFDLAEEQLDFVLARNPKSIDATSYAFDSFYFRCLILKGSISKRQGHDDEATRLWDKAVNFFLSDQSLMRTGNRLYLLQVYTLLGRRNEAKSLEATLKSMDVDKNLMRKRIAAKGTSND